MEETDTGTGTCLEGCGRLCVSCEDLEGLSGVSLGCEGDCQQEGEGSNERGEKHGFDGEGGRGSNECGRGGRGRGGGRRGEESRPLPSLTRERDRELFRRREEGER